MMITKKTISATTLQLVRKRLPKGITMKASVAMSSLRLTAIVSFALLTGLSALYPNRNTHADEPVAFYGFDETSMSADAKQGMEDIFAGRLFHGGIPAGVAKMGIYSIATSGKIGYNPNSPEGTFYAFGNCPSPPQRTEGGGTEVPLGTSNSKQDGVLLTNINCMACHAGVVNGQVVAGLGNSHITQSTLKRNRTRGDNFGPYGVWQLGAMLDDPASTGLKLAKGKTELMKLFRSVELAPVDPQPWWLMKYKTKDYWYADAGPHDAASFSINFTTPHDKMNELHTDHVQLVAKALAFARETQSPPYPGKLNADLVKQGADLFHGRVQPQNKTGFRTCKNCHGSYEKYSTHPELDQPGHWTVDYNYSHVIRNVKTDSAYNTVLRKFEPIVEQFNQLHKYYENLGTPELAGTATVPSKDGYVAPPLVGIWASAPYFHNGSVPTIETVLNSKLRPEIWKRSNEDMFAYDLESVGMAYQPITREDFQNSAAATEGKVFLAKEVVDHGANYDTAEYGHGNMGHTFGDSLTNDERMAVIEFLKSLSGPDMKPKNPPVPPTQKVTSVDR